MSVHPRHQPHHYNPRFSPFSLSFCSTASLNYVNFSTLATHSTEVWLDALTFWKPLVFFSTTAHSIDLKKETFFVYSSASASFKTCPNFSTLVFHTQNIYPGNNSQPSRKRGMLSLTPSSSSKSLNIILTRKKKQSSNMFYISCCGVSLVEKR